jgi:hypothetical protein
MVRGPCTFRPGDVTRAIREVEAAGKKIRKVSMIVIEIAQDDDAATIDGESNEWDAEYGPDQTKVR